VVREGGVHTCGLRVDSWPWRLATIFLHITYAGSMQLSRGASGCFGANGLMITSTPEGRFVHWKGMKLSDLLEAEDRLVAHLEPLPF
jgi:hypothetical protein